MHKAHLAVIGVICVAVVAGLAGERLSRLQFGFAAPPMTDTELAGETLYEASCAVCHADPRQGSGLRGPALVSGPYGPGAVGLAQISRATSMGSGSMPAVSGLAREDIQAISDYLVYRAALPQ